jgi:valyl-tRNA synthetase
MEDFPKNYDPSESEEKWYKIWEEKGYFKPEINPDGEPYTIVIPPPNVTGQLHMGHALNATLQDSIIRWRRMRGQRVLWVPGMDHAGIATQNVVERQLDSEGLSRHDLGREKFVARVWEWKKEYGGRIINQLKRVGASCDWSRERFTMDEGLSKAVREVFVRLYEEDLIYRDNKLINWCPRCNTALSDLEVEHEDLDGTLTNITYPLVDGTGSVTVATTRPETMLGDTAVAVHPSDERYKDFIGKELILPLTGRNIPVVTDHEVDPDFGTGAVKVTPAHDFNDEAIGKRQSPPLPAIKVIGQDGSMTAEAGERYAGKDRYECRRMVIADLKERGYLGEIEDHKHSVGHCYRCKTTIEPLGTPQWFVKIEPLAKPALAAVRNGDINIYPEGWKNSYYSWMENIRDWCITRQIWWGHRIPVWYCTDCEEIIVSREDPTKCTKCGSENIEQDPDVLDTWFSSALWPFSTLGWPDDTSELKDFYPTGVLVTGFDIIFFWVARMIMMGLKFMDDVPFKDVYIHALVRDEQGHKMSKSKGNVVDPLIMSDKYGADCFRFTLAAFAAQGRDVKFSEARVEGYRHFINKLWNATRFILMNLKEDYVYPKGEYLRARVENRSAEDTSLASRWILSRLAATADEINSAFDEYRYNDAANAIYQFTWHEFCDWYIEMVKTDMNTERKDTLLYTVETILRLLHPIMPFVTEEIWQRLPISHEAESIMIARFPEGLARDTSAEVSAALVMEAISGIRNIRGEINVPPSEQLDVVLKLESPDSVEVLKQNMHYIERLARATVTDVGVQVPKPDNAYTAVRTGLEVYVSLKGIDVTAELERLNKEKGKVQKALVGVEKKLQNRDFMDKAPEAVVKKVHGQHDEYAAKLSKINDSIEKLS